jgi:hypothetical protein
MFIHESRPLEMWSIFFYADNSEAHNAAFKLLKGRGKGKVPLAGLFQHYSRNGLLYS